jgi:hypothetical protein
MEEWDPAINDFVLRCNSCWRTNTNEIIQNIEVNQICEDVQICLIDLHDLNSQINYSDK